MAEGGGIYNAGTLTITGSTISANRPWLARMADRAAASSAPAR